MRDVAREHSVSSKGEKVVDGALVGAARGGILGSMGGALIGTLYGALSSVANPLTWIGAVAGLIVGAAAGPTAGLVVGLAVPAVHAVGGAATGLLIGTGVGVGVFGAKGALAGGAEAELEGQNYARQKENAKELRANAIQRERADAAHDAVAQAYPVIFQEAAQYGANSVIKQIIAAKQAQMANGGAEMPHAERHADKKPKHGPDAHAQAAAEASAQATIEITPPL